MRTSADSLRRPAPAAQRPASVNNELCEHEPDILVARVHAGSLLTLRGNAAPTDVGQD
jgi:hypothetical protein